MPKMRPTMTEVARVMPRMLMSIYGENEVITESRKARM